VAALRSLASNFPGPAPVELKISKEVADLEQPGGVKLEDGLKLTLYRVAEEALTNAAKHAAATGIEIDLGLYGQGSIRLCVTDRGQGFDPSTQAPGFGMLNMKDYAGARGGELTVESVPQEGTGVTAMLPLKFRDGS
jgi:signal transduction histidine kinase